MGIADDAEIQWERIGIGGRGLIHMNAVIGINEREGERGEGMLR